jgi:hypothetical protein
LIIFAPEEAEIVKDYVFILKLYFDSAHNKTVLGWSVPIPLVNLGISVSPYSFHS